MIASVALQNLNFSIQPPAYVVINLQKEISVGIVRLVKQIIHVFFVTIVFVILIILDMLFPFIMLLPVVVVIVEIQEHGIRKVSVQNMGMNSKKP